LSVAVRAPDEGYVCDDAVDDVGFVDGETLVFPEVAVDYSFPDGLLHYGCGVETIGGERP